MRQVIAAVLVTAAFVFSASCGKGDHEASASDRDIDASEQVKFDAERHPEKIVVALGIGPGSHVADIGAGSGLLTVHLARAVGPSGKVVATDISADVLGLMKKRLAKDKLDGIVEERVVQAEQTGLEDGAFDAILLAEVDNYFVDPVAWLQNAKKALKPGGKIVIENRIHRRTGAMAAAQKAGLVLQSETNRIPSNFIAVFTI